MRSDFSIEFTESELSDLQSVADRLFSNMNDPTSTAYRRVLNRPRISWIRVLLSCMIPLLAAASGGSLLVYLGFGFPIVTIVVCSICVGYILIRAKAAVICLVRIYQRYAPDAVRRKCRFEPSCSEYMIQAVERYGAFRGVPMGIARLRRCKPGFGGFEPLD